jgi:hypothetical protein
MPKNLNNSREYELKTGHLREKRKINFRPRPSLVFSPRSIESVSPIKNYSSISPTKNETTYSDYEHPEVAKIREEFERIEIESKMMLNLTTEKSIEKKHQNTIEP